MIFTPMTLLIKKRQRGVKKTTPNKKEQKRERKGKCKEVQKEEEEGKSRTKKREKNSEVLAFLSPRAKLCCCLLELGLGQV